MSGHAFYHDIYVTTADLGRRRLFDLPFGYEITCNRVAGWSLWKGDTLIAGEFHEVPLSIDVAGHPILGLQIDTDEEPQR